MLYTSELSNLTTGLLLPPGLNIFLMILAALVYPKLKWFAYILSAIALITLSIFSLPKTAIALHEQLNIYPVLDVHEQDAGEKNTAILVLGQGDTRTAPELGYIDTIGAKTLERLRYAAFLHNKLDLPLMVSGGRKNNRASPESVLANQVLIDEFKVAPKWLESQSSKPDEQILYSADLLKKNDIAKVYLVTHTIHMHAALNQLEKYQFKVIAAPIVQSEKDHPKETLTLWLPSAAALSDSQEILEQHLIRFVNWW